MKAAVLIPGRPAPGPFLQIEELPTPEPQPGYVLFRVFACGVCRTDLHIVEGDLPPLRPRLIPGHQIVGEVAGGVTADLPWNPCRRLMDRRRRWRLLVLPSPYGKPLRQAYLYRVQRRWWLCGVRLGPRGLRLSLARRGGCIHVAPLLCAGIIGFRSLRVAGVQPGERVGLFGFGSSASLAIAVLQSWKCEVYVSTRGEKHRQTRVSLGATWVGKEDQTLPVELDRAITFAPSGKVVVSALSACVRAVVAINAIHLDQMPAFDYDKLLWGERQIRSVANMTRQDARDFLAIASQLKIHPQVTVFPLQEANRALLAVKEETERGSAVIVP